MGLPETLERTDFTLTGELCRELLAWALRQEDVLGPGVPLLENPSLQDLLAARTTRRGPLAFISSRSGPWTAAAALSASLSLSETVHRSSLARVHLKTTLALCTPDSLPVLAPDVQAVLAGVISGVISEPLQGNYHRSNWQANLPAAVAGASDPLGAALGYSAALQTELRRAWVRGPRTLTLNDAEDIRRRAVQAALLAAPALRDRTWPLLTPDEAQVLNRLQRAVRKS